MTNGSHKVVVFITIIYLSVVIAFSIWHRIGLSPDQFFAVGLGLTLILGRGKQFIRDWSLPMLLILGYEYLRGLVPSLINRANIYPMINFDINLFGYLPTTKLQSLLYSPIHLSWYDYAGTLLYMIHFIVPMVFAFILWLNHKEQFKKYSVTLIILSYAAFITYIVFPAMPPWLASNKGIIPGVYKILETVFANFPKALSLPSVYQFIGANLVAAVPSLHAAYPTVTFLFLLKIWRYKALIFLPYVLGTWFAVVYLGEHYVFDAVVGAGYAAICYLIVNVPSFRNSRK